MSVWDRVYYCGKDDLVFLPGRGSNYPANQLTTLIREAGGDPGSGITGGVYVAGIIGVVVLIVIVLRLLGVWV
jgi:hypothetical protein